MNELNKSRSNGLLSACFMYSFITMLFLGIAVFKKNELYLEASFICFVITTVTMLTSYYFDMIEDNTPGLFSMLIGLILMVPYTIVFFILTIFTNLILNIFFRRRDKV